jgi:hypothetical protein
MEHAPKSVEMTPAQIEAKVTALQQEIIALEEKMRRTHQESGDNSSDDNGQEEVMDIQDREIMASQIADKRNEMVRLQDLIFQAQKAA